MIFSATKSHVTAMPMLLGSLATTTLVQYLIFIGAILLVVGIVALWAVYIRRKPRQRRYKYHRAPRNTELAEEKKPRRKRRSEPPMNPTLAETRGLPPLRDSRSANEHYQS